MGEERTVSYCLMGAEFQFCKMKSLKGGWRWWLHNSVNVHNATELDTGKLSPCPHGTVRAVYTLPQWRRGLKGTPTWKRYQLETVSLAASLSFSLTNSLKAPLAEPPSSRGTPKWKQSPKELKYTNVVILQFKYSVPLAPGACFVWH